MNIWQQENFSTQHEGTSYTFTELNIDISEEFDQAKGSMILSHKIEGFEVPIYMVENIKEGMFFFGYKAVDDGNDHGLFMTLQDKEIYDKAVALVTSIN